MEDSIWKLIWRWQGPEKMKTFLWLFAHGRIHTSQLRHLRGLEGGDGCPMGCGQVEDELHLVRDCPAAREYWKAALLPAKWDLFFSLSRTDWVKWNLTHDAGMPHTHRIPWSTLFGYMCWDVWVHRCTCLFDTQAPQRQLNLHQSLFKASSDQELRKTGGVLFSHVGATCRAPGELEPCTNLICDGSVLQDGRSGCGGYILDHNGEWLGGFSCKLTMVPSVFAELLGLIHGLNWCWDRGHREVVIYSDSTEAINYILRGCELNHPYIDIVTEARKCYYRSWDIQLHHVTRDFVQIADRLAKLSHSLDVPFCLFDQPPAFVTREEVDRS